jgi:hypothetical protein
MSDEPLEYVRQAALQLIAVARSALDLAEDLVLDPRGLAEVVGQVGKLAEAVIEGALPARPAAEPEPEPKVEHIPIR